MKNFSASFDSEKNHLVMSYTVDIYEEVTDPETGETSEMLTQRDEQTIQKNWPNKTPWANEAEALDWSEKFLASTTGESNFYPPVGPGIAPEEKEPIPEPVVDEE